MRSAVVDLAGHMSVFTVRDWVAGREVIDEQEIDDMSNNGGLVWKSGKRNLSILKGGRGC